MNGVDFYKTTPCGGCCDDCQHLINGDCVGCKNSSGKCVKLWIDGCEIYNCCNKHNVLFCGLCDEFPCKWIVSKISEWNPAGIEELSKLATQYRLKELKD